MPRSKPIAVLLDANVIIEGFRVSAWEAIVSEFEVYVPSIVIQEVHRLPRNPKPEYIPVDLSSYIEKGQISEIEASVQELLELKEQYKAVFLQKELHDGEEEALALARADRPENAVLCTSDAAAIQAIAMVDMREKGISLEELLKKMGYSKRLRPQYAESFFTDNLDIGSLAMITGSVLPGRKKPRKKRTKRRK